jgi:hypothetical protein
MSEPCKCRFCGRVPVVQRVNADDDWPVWQVQCGTCGAAGPKRACWKRPVPKQAISPWNLIMQRQEKKLAR